MFETTGVKVVIDGYGTYRLQAAGVNQATNSMVQTSQRAQSQTRGFSQGLRQIAGNGAALAVGMGGLSLAVLGTAAALKGSAGAAIAFESSFAGIRKTLDATEAEFKALAQANRNLAKDIPTSVNELNRIGELAGQLGVTGSANILKFERTIADLTNTTNLTAEEGATAFAQIANILELPIANVDRLASSVVELGNKGESTETEITEFALRIAGAGKIAGLTADEITGIGAAFANVGVQAEAGGTSIQRILIAMVTAVTKGGKELEVFAKTAGLSVEAFKSLAETDPAEAFIRFFEGLSTAGNEAILVLDELGLADQRVIRAALSVAQAGNELRESVDQSSTAFRENTALTVEAEKRYRTTAARLQVLRNNFEDAAISAGDKLLPALLDASDAAIKLLNAVKPLGGILPSIATALGVVAAGFAAFVALRAAASITAAATAFAQLAVQARTAAQGIALLQAAGISPLGLALGGIAVAVVAADLAMRHFTGGGILDFVTGAKAAEKRAEELRKEIKRLQGILASAPSTGTGAAVAVGVEIDRIRAAQREIATLDKRLTAGDGPVGRRFRELKGDIEEAREALKGLLVEASPEAKREILFQIRVLGGADLDEELAKTIREETASAALASSAFSDLSLDLAELDAGNKAAASSGDDLARTFTEGADLAQTYADAIEHALSQFEDRIDPVTASLRLQVAVLEEQRRELQAAGGDTAALDARIESLNNAIEQSTSAMAQNKAAVDLAASALQQAEVSAGRAEQILGDFARELDNIPEVERTDILLALPDLEMTRFLRFLDLVADGVTATIALRIAQAPARELKRGDPGSFPFTDEGLAEHNRKANEQALRDLAFANGEVATSSREAALSAGNFAEAAGGSGGAATVIDHLTATLQAAADGAISLSEALSLGIDEQQAATLELEIMRQKAEDGRFHERVELIKTARAFEGLSPEQVKFRLGLKAIADNLKETNRTVAEFTLDSLTTALDGFRSELDRVLNRPTKETLQLDLKLLELQRRRAQRKAGGATDEDLEGIDREIDNLRELQELRRIELDIERTKIELGDATVLTDREQMDQTRLLGTAIAKTSDDVKKMGGVVFNQTLAQILLTQRALLAADALGGLAIRANQAGPVPQAANGLIGDFGSGTLVMLHHREAVVPLDRGFAPLPQFNGGGGGGSVFAPTLSQLGLDKQAARRQFHQWVDEWVAGSASRSDRGGAALSEGIG